MFNRTFKRIARFFSTKFPGTYYNLIQRPRLHFRFWPEKRFARGEGPKSSRPSIIFFTTQKCASRFVSGILATLSRTAGMEHADYDAYVTMVRVPLESNPFSGSLVTAFRPKGFYYGPIGSYRQIPNFEKYKVLLQLRDPRDVVTSLYFSTVYSHAVISPKLVRRRREASQMDIDEFAIMSAEEYLPIYLAYCEKLLGQPNVLFVKYEEMVANFEGWLTRLATYTGLSDQSQALEKIRSETDFSVTGEDKFAQRRQVLPGDHKRKLKPETVGQLNDIFTPILNKLNYPI